jgi:hypothetical protein
MSDLSKMRGRARVKLDEIETVTLSGRVRHTMDDE